METQLGSKFVHTAFAAAIVTLLTGGAGAQQCALPPNCTVSSGNVGIGTTSPATKLHVLGPGGGGVVATFDQPTGINFVDLRALDSRGPVGTALRFFGAPASLDGLWMSKVLSSPRAGPALFSCCRCRRSGEPLDKR
jgi:hypothetical protein